VEFCWEVSTRLKQLYVRWPSRVQLPGLAEEFKKLHGLPRVVGAIDGSYLQIDPPPTHAADYYCRKGYHAIALQAICDARSYFWDYHVGWCASMHDFNVFTHTPAAARIAEGGLHGHMLLGDAAYPPRSYMLSPYKAVRGRNLLPHEQDFNYKQSASRMPIERAFGLLKGRWRILLGRVPGTLQNVPKVVGCCVVLHNLCIVFHDSFSGEWLSGLLVEHPTAHEVHALSDTMGDNM